jgi:hypothetical protein
MPENAETKAPAIQFYPTVEGRLPASRTDVVELEELDDPHEGQLVAVYSRGSGRVAQIEKVGPKRLQVKYVTAGGRRDAEKSAAIDQVLQVEEERCRAEKAAERYRAMADAIERLGVEPTEDNAYESKWVAVADLPDELRQLELAGGASNAARTTIVYKPDTLRGWAVDAVGGQATARYEERLADARVDMRKTFEQRVAERTHITGKSVKRDQCFAIKGVS